MAFKPPVASAAAPEAVPAVVSPVDSGFLSGRLLLVGADVVVVAGVALPKRPPVAGAVVEVGAAVVAELVVPAEGVAPVVGVAPPKRPLSEGLFSAGFGLSNRECLAALLTAGAEVDAGAAAPPRPPGFVALLLAAPPKREPPVAGACVAGVVESVAPNKDVLVAGVDVVAAVAAPVNIRGAVVVVLPGFGPNNDGVVVLGVVLAGEVFVFAAPPNNPPVAGVEDGPAPPKRLPEGGV